MRWLFYLSLFLLPAGLVLFGDSGEQEICLVPPLVTAAETGDLAAVEQLLGKNGSADLRDSCDWTALMKAALNGHKDIVQRLIAHGAEIDAVDEGGYTALMLAASNNHLEIVGFLLQAGANINHHEHTNGWTASSWASRQGHGDMVALLKKHGSP